MKAHLLNRFYSLCKSVCTYIFIYILFSNSALNAATLKVNNGFESGGLSGLRCSGNCPSVVKSPIANGNYSGEFTLTRNMNTPYRTEVVLDKKDGFFEFGKEYWLGVTYRYENWQKDSSAEMSPFQIHTRPSSWDSVCAPGGSAWSAAPFFMASKDDKAKFVTYGGKVLWIGTVEKKKWLNTVVHFRLSSGNDGFIEVWKDGIKLGRTNGPNGKALDKCGKPFRAPYLKLGVYKWDWKAGRAATDSTRRQVLLDNIKIAEGSNGYSLVSSTQHSTLLQKTDVSAPIISNVQAAVTNMTATISWSTNEASDSLVKYGATRNYGLSANNNILVTNHKVTLKNLEEGKLYHYQVSSKDSNGNIGGSYNLTFTTKLIIESELVAHWSMDATTGASIDDVSGNGNTGTLVNGAKLISDGYIKFDGYNDYLDVGKLDVSGNEITISAWFLADDLSNCPYRDCRIISKATGTGEQDHYFMVSTVKTGSKTRLRFRLKTNGITSTLIATSGDLSENEWIHVTAVYDGKTMRLYKDGIEVGSTAKQGNMTINSKAPVWIGSNPLNAKERSWEGYIDDVQIYNYALTGPEISELGSSSIPTTTDTLPPEISNVQVSVTGTSAIISWNSNEASSSLVKYGLTSLYESHVNNNLLVTNHKVTLGNLVAGKLYHYQVSSEDSNRNIGENSGLTFTTDSLSKEFLVAHWAMEATKGTSIEDISGNGNTGVLVNGAEVVSDEGIRFDGYNDYLDAGKLDVSGNEITISAWFLANDLSNCPYRDCRIISKATGTGEQDHYFMLSTVKTGSKTRLRFRLKTNGVTSTLIATSGDLSENEWIHVTAVYDGETMRLYKDGVEVGSTAKQGNITTNSKTSVWVGGNPRNEKARPWKGYIDDIQIYSYSLTDDEIILLADI